MRPQTLEQHVAGIDVRGLFDLKKDHAVFALGDSLATADIISRRFVN